MNARLKGSGMRRFSMAVCVAVSIATAIAFASSASFAASVRELVSPARRGVAADVLRLHADVRDFGLLNDAAPVRIGILLKYRHENELGPLTIEQGDRRSPYFHRYLSIAQWNNYFAPDEETYVLTERKLVRAGFRIEQTFRNRGMIRAVGSARVAARYFQTRFHRVIQAKHGYRYINVTPAIMPAELAQTVVAVTGLHSVVSYHFPLHKSTRPHRSGNALVRGSRPPDTIVALATPKPITTSTPVPNPIPDPTESPNVPLSDMASAGGYGPSIFADAYDLPVQHGYGGRGHAAGSVIDSDYSNADANLEWTTYGVPRTQTAGNSVRVCTDPNDACTICNPSEFATTCDNEGESTLDAQTIQGLSPAADFYEYLTNTQDSIDDLDVDAAYERVVSDDIVDAVNSSFG